jgi:hypothetical protein
LYTRAWGFETLGEIRATARHQSNDRHAGRAAVNEKTGTCRSVVQGPGRSRQSRADDLKQVVAQYPSIVPVLNGREQALLASGPAAVRTRDLARLHELI